MGEVSPEAVEELDALSAIYGEELRLEEEGKWSIELVAEHRPEPRDTRLFFALPGGYPTSAPPRYELFSPHLLPRQVKPTS